MNLIRPTLTAFACTILVAAVLAPTTAARMPPPELDASSDRLQWTYDDGDVWMVGNTHVHSAPHTPYGPGQLALRYRELGQDFMFLTDHDAVTPGADVDGFLTLSGVEVSIHRNARSPHVVALDVEQPLAWVGRTHEDVLAEIDDRGGFSILAHPEYVCASCRFPSWTVEQLRETSGYDAIELFTSSTSLSKGHPPRGPALPYWFAALADGRQVWAVATDDAHKTHTFGRAFIIVQTDDGDAEGIVAALHDGRFMAAIVPEPSASPPWPSYMGIVDDRLVLLAAPMRGPARVHVYDETGSLRHTSEAGALEYVVAGDEGRLIVHMEAQDGGHLFLQPITVAGDSQAETLVEVVLDPAVPIGRSTPADALPLLAVLLVGLVLRRR